MALVLDTSDISGLYVLGFRVENIDEMFHELSSLFESYRQKPIFGVQCRFEEAETDIKKVTIPRVEDREKIVETGYEHVRSIQNTYAIHKKQKNRAQRHQAQDQSDEVVNDDDIVFNEDLGLACEKLPPNVTMENLWKIA